MLSFGNDTKYMTNNTLLALIVHGTSSHIFLNVSICLSLEMQCMWTCVSFSSLLSISIMMAIEFELNSKWNQIWYWHSIHFILYFQVSKKWNTNWKRTFIVRDIRKLAIVIDIHNTTTVVWMSIKTLFTQQILKANKTFNSTPFLSIIESKQFSFFWAMISQLASTLDEGKWNLIERRRRRYETCYRKLYVVRLLLKLNDLSRVGSVVKFSALHQLQRCLTRTPYEVCKNEFDERRTFASFAFFLLEWLEI